MDLKYPQKPQLSKHKNDFHNEKKSQHPLYLYCNFVYLVGDSVQFPVKVGHTEATKVTDGGFPLRERETGQAE